MTMAQRTAVVAVVVGVPILFMLGAEKKPPPTAAEKARQVAAEAKQAELRESARAACVIMRRLCTEDPLSCVSDQMEEALQICQRDYNR